MNLNRETQKQKLKQITHKYVNLKYFEPVTYSTCFPKGTANYIKLHKWMRD